jgi:sirohydrochlorin ferrochelatase
MFKPAESSWRSDEDAVLVLVGHGSRLPGVDADLAALARAVASSAGFPTVEACRLADLVPALDRCAAGGAHLICVQPIFLSMVGELASKLRGQARAFQAAHPAVRIAVGEGLGEHSLLTEALRDSALQALSGVRGAVVLVGHGSPAPGWGEALLFQAERLRRVGVFDEVLPAFLDHEQPSLGDVLEGLGDEEVVIVPFFLSRGAHLTRELPSLLCRLQHPTGRVRLAPFWAADPRLALAVADQAQRLPTSLSWPSSARRSDAASPRA